MTKRKEVGVWLGHLQKTMNFELVASKVFGRVTHGEGQGLIIVQGPSGIANKTFFLNTVKAFQKGVPSCANTYFSDDLQRLLAEVDISHYQCVDIKEDYPSGIYDNLYRVPLYIALPLSLASASQKRGLKEGHKIVVLCDDLHEFIPHNQESNLTFLKQLAELLHNLKDITFLGAYTLNYYGKGLEDTVLSNYVLALGYD